MHIHTLTCNLLAETTYTFTVWRAGKTQRAEEETFQVGGKGINVTRMLTRLGMDSTALFFSGGAGGKRCEAWLHEQRIPHRAFSTPAEARSGAVVRAPGIPETTFLGAENVISAAAITDCADHLDGQPSGDVLVIAGSIPAWADGSWDPLREAVQRWLRRGTLIVDTYGAALPWFAARTVHLIKINRREFAAFAGVKESAASDDRMPELLAKCSKESPAGAWVITDGRRPVWYCTAGQQPALAVPPVIEEISSTGSGDVFTAGLLVGRLHRQMDLGAAVSFALPLAAANAAHPGVAAFDLTPFGDFPDG